MEEFPGEDDVDELNRFVEDVLTWVMSHPRHSNPIAHGADPGQDDIDLVRNTAGRVTRPSGELV